MHGCRLVAAGGQAKVALPVKALKAGQEAYWLDQIARNREEYFSGRGESPGPVRRQRRRHRRPGRDRQP